LILPSKYIFIPFLPASSTCSPDCYYVLLDRGIYETNNDQVQSNNQYEAQEIIASRAVLKFFGPIVCPSNCLGPDDSQSWLSLRGHHHGDVPLHGKHSTVYTSSIQVDRNHVVSSGHNHLQTLSNTDSILPTLENKSELSCV
jgi:hypothetical protein